MYSGHFALINLLRRYFPSTSPYILSFGVGLADIAFGILCLLDVEGYSVEPANKESITGGLLIHCHVSHSLIGSIILSAAYGALCGSFVAGFVASSTHFMLDWIVHNRVLYLDPMSNIVVGGTRLMSVTAFGAYLLETAICVGCAFAAPQFKSYTSMVFNIIVLALHGISAVSLPATIEQMVALDHVARQRVAGVSMLMAFVIPSLVFGALLDSKRIGHQDRKSA
ncbi:hypothetical protein BX666DRAFT_1917546 [Dichotomocladium elegans]|nr:hypothetical protein BX666DRAFT_1917546 [Dichotomocladium elegans]